MNSRLEFGGISLDFKLKVEIKLNLSRVVKPTRLVLNYAIDINNDKKV